MEAAHSSSFGHCVRPKVSLYINTHKENSMIVQVACQDHQKTFAERFDKNVNAFRAPDCAYLAATILCLAAKNAKRSWPLKM